MRVAIVHDWLTGTRGGERVLEAMLEIFPAADLFTLVHAPGSVSARIEARPITTSFIQRLPRSRTHWRHYLPLFPLAIERLDVHDYDLVLSSSHCAAKSARRRADAVHVSYCHTPMRYVWDLYDAYFGPDRASAPVRGAMRVLAPRLRSWDRRTSSRVDAFVANSRNVAARIGRAYGRDAAVVYPPVEVDRFTPAGAREDFYLMVTALVPYKRVDIAIDAFRVCGRDLIVVGGGPELDNLRARAPRNVTFAGRLSDPDVADLFGRCRAYVQPGEEDFGIAMVEAQAAGAPVIAFGAGGALETVIDGAGNGDRERPTGLLFRPQTPEALARAVERFESLRFDTAHLRENARRFEPRRFRSGFMAAVDAALAGSESAGRCA